ncbi:MAG: error-prone DNA polymerase [Pseudomonadota bacterium]
MSAQPYFAELGVTTNFSFLRGASHASELVIKAQALGLNAIGVADHNTLAGVVRAHIAAKEAGLRLLIGARLVPEDGPALLCYPETRAAYGRLSSLLSKGKLAAEKGECNLTLADIKDYAAGQVFILMPPEAIDTHFEAHVKDLAETWRGRLYLAATYNYDGRNRERIGRLAALAARTDLPLVATNDVLHHEPGRKPLQDVMTCIRERCTMDTVGRRLLPNAERHLKAPAEMARLFEGYENTLARTCEIVDRCSFSLDELSYEYPDEPVPPGTTPQSHLTDLAWKGAAWRYPKGAPPHVKTLIKKELSLIEELGYAKYFLTVHDIVAWARGQDILCQGRGSAANSALCYCLGVTSVDPNETSLLFERFLSKERKEPPDIDVDFEHERREEVIQYVYRRYGRHRAALTATVICYRPRSAVREVCKALGLTEDVAAALAGTVWGSWGKDIVEKQITGAGLDPSSPTIKQAVALTRTLIGFPRHLSQHVGGFVLTQGPLIETVPIGNAAMEERTFIEWDKDDIDALKIMKVDVLALGMLTCIRKSFDLLKHHKSIEHDLASLPQGDKATYDMLCEGDSLGVFQVESRAQMNMLPRLRPQEFYDLVIEVAIVRPGPIQGDMVHPYLRRRKKLEKVDYPSPAPEHGPPDELEKILKRTLGVPLFQEQAMQISIDAAKFTPDEANGLRRAMATFRKVGTINNYQDMMVNRMIARGYEPAFAARCFDQVKGFGEYGFPESHAASFALLVYVSSWLKCHHPDVFCAALLNSQPMGFYAPAQIVRDARDHGVEVRPVDVNHSHWDNTLERIEAPQTESDKNETACTPRHFAVRLGFRQVSGANEEEIRRLVEARGRGYATPQETRRHAGLSRRMSEILANADAFGSMGLSRRRALWAMRGETAARPSPLFESTQTPEQPIEQAPEKVPEQALKPTDIERANTEGRTPKRPADALSDQFTLPLTPPSEEVIQDYQMTNLSLKNHPVRFLRETYAHDGILSTADAVARPNGAFVKTAGVVLVRQKPGSAKGVVFITIEDETGIANLVVWSKVLERYRATVMGARLLCVAGRVQRADHVTHIVAGRLIDRTGDLALLSEDAQNRGHTPDPFLALDPLKGALANGDEVRRPVIEHRIKRSPLATPGNNRHPRNVRIIPKSRDFH